MFGRDLTFVLLQSKNRDLRRARFRQFAVATRFDTLWADYCPTLLFVANRATLPSKGAQNGCNRATPSSMPDQRLGPSGVARRPHYAMQYRIACGHSLDDVVLHVPLHIVDDVPANIPRALLPEYITEGPQKRSPQIAMTRNLRMLRLVTQIGQAIPLDGSYLSA